LTLFDGGGAARVNPRRKIGQVDTTGCFLARFDPNDRKADGRGFTQELIHSEVREIVSANGSDRNDCSAAILGHQKESGVHENNGGIDVGAVNGQMKSGLSLRWGIAIFLPEEKHRARRKSWSNHQTAYHWPLYRPLPAYCPGPTVGARSRYSQTNGRSEPNGDMIQQIVAQRRPWMLLSCGDR
jgi:hypothetical protein